MEPRPLDDMILVVYQSSKLPWRMVLAKSVFGDERLMDSCD